MGEPIVALLLGGEVKDYCLFGLWLN